MKLFKDTKNRRFLGIIGLFSLVPGAGIGVILASFLFVAEGYDNRFGIVGQAWNWAVVGTAVQLCYLAIYLASTI